MTDETGTMRSTLNAQRSTLNAQRSTLNAQRSTPNAQRPTPNAFLCPNSDEIIHVVLAVYDPSGTYSQHAGVVMTSIFENTKSKVTVHILHDDTLTEDNRQKFMRTAEKYLQTVEFHDIAEHKKKINAMKLHIPQRLTVGAVYRGCIPEILNNIDKVIYLDCDVLVNLDIVELWSINFDNKSLIGVIDSCMLGKSQYSFTGFRIRMTGGSSESYLNSGVLMMNLKKIRSSLCLFERVTEWLKRYGYLGYTADQGALNAIFRGDIKFVDTKFNRYHFEEDMSNSIIHCMWIEKPWTSLSGFAPDHIYWQMYIRSPWGENMTRDELIDKLVSLVRPSVYLHRRGIQCVKRIIHSLYSKDFVIFQPLSVFALYMKDLLFRLKCKFMRS